ncbi:hypothetical protein SFC65_19630 [Priestia filamentosa]|uniref:hypothetical protein n=1 Tax=Priestia filamentosa TaxID=1402861 RepID=UPI003982AC30
MLSKLVDKVKDLFGSVDTTLEEDEELCPVCKGIGTEDVFLDCEFCDGEGKVKNSQCSS